MWCCGLTRARQEFDEDDAITKMRGSKNWPRPLYASPDPDKWRRAAILLHDDARSRAAGCADELVDRFSALAFQANPDKEQACQTLQAIVKTSPIRPELARECVNLVAMTDAEIKQAWELNRDLAANQGTWFHLQAELWLNRDECYLEGPEMGLFLQYVTRHLEPLGVVAYRTEWEVFGEEEDLAGSVDFVGEYRSGPYAGQLFLGDWKRSKDLRNKKTHLFGTMMRAPLDAVPDAACWHYCLQVRTPPRPRSLR